MPVLHKMNVLESDEFFHAFSETDQDDNLTTKFVTCESNQAFQATISKKLVTNLKKDHPKVQDWISEAFLSGEANDYFFKLEDNKLIWMKQAKSILLKICELTIIPIDVIATHHEMFSIAVKDLNETKTKRSHFENKSNILSEKNKELLIRMDQMSKAKNELETDLYSHFLPILNAKKERIRELEKKCRQADNDSQTINNTSSAAHTISSSDDDIEDSDHNISTANKSLDNSQNFLNL